MRTLLWLKNMPLVKQTSSISEGGRGKEREREE